MASIKKFLKQQAYNVSYGMGDPDHPNCPHCGTVMNFHGGDRVLGDGFWDCSGCDFTFTEDDIRYIDV